MEDSLWEESCTHFWHFMEFEHFLLGQEHTLCSAMLALPTQPLTQKVFAPHMGSMSTESPHCSWLLAVLRPVGRRNKMGP